MTLHRRPQIGVQPAEPPRARGDGLDVVAAGAFEQPRERADRGPRRVDQNQTPAILAGARHVRRDRFAHCGNGWHSEPPRVVMSGHFRKCESGASGQNWARAQDYFGRFQCGR